ncbi:MAG: hypothetical protein PVI03_04645 [Candidatus Thorarchaeota archaeon]|jgi:hypothetical protein
MFLNKDKYRRQGAMMVFHELSKLPKGGLVTIEDTDGDKRTFKRVK